MVGILAGRLGHYTLLMATALALTLPNLGVPSLWDVDEGVNAEATREMMETGTWIVPTFNYELRTAKPVMLYWLQRASYSVFGVSEWSARFPAVILGLGTVLLVYELARRMFDPGTGFLSGVVLASAIEFCKLSHAATPDAPLIFFTVLALVLFWFGHERGGRAWFIPCAMAAGLAALTKGPVGLALPGSVVFVYFAWNRELKRFWDKRLLLAAVTFLLVAAPWYILVTSETRGAYARAFFGTENVNRFMNPMEGHKGPIVYYLGAMFVFFAPWCIYLGGAVWYAVKGSRTSPAIQEPGLERQRRYRFLLSWVGCYLLFFSVAATKLPNYIAPLYPAISILTASMLVRWRQGTINPARWVMPTAAAGMATMGMVVGVGILVASGVISIPAKGMRIMPELAPWSALALLPLVGAGVMAWQLRTNNRAGVLATSTFVAVSFVGLLAAGPTVIIDRYKAPKELVMESGTDDVEREIRIASLEYTQPSVTFYAKREVKRLATVEAAVEFLTIPTPGYVFVPAPTWEHLQKALPKGIRIAARRFDLYRNCDVLVVTNEMMD